jgi:hypothetical protein
MEPLDIAKMATCYMVGAGTGKIVTSIIRNNIEDPENLYKKIQIVGAGVVLGMMAKDATKKYTDAKIDEYVAFYNETVKPQIKKFAA